VAPEQLKLSLSIVGRSDITRMLREINKLDDFFVAAASRPANSSIQPPRITNALNQLARDNRVNLLEAGQRKELVSRLNAILKQAPALNISFASEPSPKSLEQILIWFRQNIHPLTLLQVGLQPSIAAGCVLRTPNELFDMSLSAKLTAEQGLLTQLIEGAANGRG